MNRSEVQELHYITPIANVASIMAKGILSHARAIKVVHSTIAMASVQTIRHAKPVPPGNRTIHDFANLYFHARNPMMFIRKAQHDSLCVLRIAPEVLDLEGAIITDQNAASDYARFYASPAGLNSLDHDVVFAADWNHPNQIEYWRRKSAKCAEVLVPGAVPPECILGAYVSGAPGLSALKAVGFMLPITINPDLFFQA